MDQDLQAARRWMFFDVALELLCIATSERFIDLSLAWEDCLGWTRAELMARPWIEFVHPDDQATTGAEARRLQRFGEEAFEFVNRYQHKDGGYRTLRWSSRVYDGLFFAVARDITDAE